jgi:DNA replication protein DnaC
MAAGKARLPPRWFIVTFKTFSAWAEIFGDPVAVAAMVDRLVHHAEVIALKGDSYRLKGRRKEVATSTETS